MSRVVALLPFKAHSERVPGKNFRLLCGQPLYCYALQALLSSETVACVFIDTDAVDLKTQLTARFPHDAHRIVVRPRACIGRARGCSASCPFALRSRSRSPPALPR
jgi:CMP-N-acetylneuraminic acid synthetase